MVWTEYPDRRLAIVETPSRRLMELDWSSGALRPLDAERAEFHDIEACGGRIAQVSEAQVAVSHGGRTVVIRPPLQHGYFMRAKFLEAGGDLRIVLLSGRYDDPSVNRLDICSLDELFPPSGHGPAVPGRE